MKLEKYVDKSKKKRKSILIGLGVIVLISVSLLLYKTFASFTETAEFPMMNGQVDYFGNSDIYFVFYQGDKELEEMPQKGNEQSLVFDRGECDNGASIVWNATEWAPFVKGLNKVKTKCSLYFKEQEKVEIGGMKVPVAENGDGLYAVTHDDLEELGQEWNKTEYRYAGADPDNYVEFNNEIWRIIGLVNVKTDSGIEQRVKIVRIDGVKEQKDFGNYFWDKRISNWTTNKLKDMLNGIYYESGIGECYSEENYSNISQCDFTGNGLLPQGLNDTSRNMIDKEVIWNLGGSSDVYITTNQYYEIERGITVNSLDNPTEWSSATDVGEKHNGIGLIYPSDYGYATNGGSIGRETCFVKELYLWDRTVENINFQSECVETDWLRPKNGDIWTLSPYYGYDGIAYTILPRGTVVGYDDLGWYNGVWPTLYLTTSTKIIDGTGDINSPFVLSVQ